MNDSSGATWFGHPRGLATLFFTEMWERFSYYGMRALLVLFMTASIIDPPTGGPGLGMTDQIAGAIYGLYTAAVYLLALPGGWIADRLLGQRKAIWYGGIIIAAGHFSMAVPTPATFYLGLILIVFGTGLLKPNISTVVGDLYPEGGSRRDAGFSIFYMGINIGAFASPLICGYLGEQINWHMGFGCAGVGMVLGIIQYSRTQHYMGDAGLHPKAPASPEQASTMWKGIWGFVALVVLVFLLGIVGVFTPDPLMLAKGATYVILGCAGAYFVYALFFAGLDLADKKRVVAIAVLLLFCALFWSGFEQAGSSLNLFGERYTDREMFSWEMPASWLQSVNALFIIAFAPFFAAFWVWLGKRNLEPSSPLKFSMGLILLGLGFAVMYLAAKIVVGGVEGEDGEPALVLPTWLILTYLLHTFGELCLSPVGLSTMTKLAPKIMVGQIMGLWFMATAFGNLIAGLVAGLFNPEAFITKDELHTEGIVLEVPADVDKATSLAMLLQGPGGDTEYKVVYDDEGEPSIEATADRSKEERAASPLPTLVAVEITDADDAEAPLLRRVDGNLRYEWGSDDLDREGEWSFQLLANGPEVNEYTGPTVQANIQRNIEDMPGLFMMITSIIIGGGVVMLLLVIPMKMLVPKED